MTGDGFVPATFPRVGSLDLALGLLDAVTDLGDIAYVFGEEWAQ